ncbi:MAG: hypothetical protein JSS35_07350, partial [Proteobacteria bacterium]|nr:hypothetical protein [Pseudomonadota bacterium]
MLAELSELGLSLARELHGRALAAETPAEADRLALAFQRVSRGVRQTFALELKIDRDRRACDRDRKAEDREEAVRLAQQAAEAREAEARAAAPEPLAPEVARRRASIEARKTRVTQVMARLIWTEAEGDESEIEMLDYDLAVRLHEASFREDF